MNLRSLAQSLSLSRTTVSDALRGCPRVNKGTRERVRAAAKAAGYVRNPLAGAVMSALRRSHGHQFRGVLAVIETTPSVQSTIGGVENELVLQGIAARAPELGFTIERFKIG